MIHLSKSGDTYDGGPNLRHVPGYPVIHAGTTGRHGKWIENITIRNVHIVGNRSKRISEMSRFGTHIRLNGISLRYCRNVLIENCIIENCRSGGIVPAYCDGVTIRNCVIRGNWYDGIAPYACSRVRIQGCTIENNDYAGVSVDGGCRYVSVDRKTSFKGNKRHDVWVCKGRGIRAANHRVDRQCGSS